MISNYQEAITYLYDSLPMFQRIGPAAYNRDLTNTRLLLNELGHPETTFKSIHVAGTNGKGSTSHMLAAVLQCAGYKTGLYTSPHLKSFTERVKINGVEVTEQFVVDFVNQIQPALIRIKPSFFEMTVGMAFEYFAKNEVDFAVIEVGLGGRLDSTNVITPEVSVITNISFDHKDLLGDTLQKIAGEKAGIIKAGVTLVVSERQPEVEEVFMAAAKEVNATIRFASDDWSITDNMKGFTISLKGKPWLKHVNPDLHGLYQRKNILGVAATIVQLRKVGFEIPDDAVREGIQRTAKLTGLKGRWQKLGERPLVIADTGHNEGGVREVLAQIEKTGYRQLHVVFGMVKDKDGSKILEMLPKTAAYYFCQAHIPRALDAEELSKQAHRVGLKGVVVPDVNDALKQARQNASVEDLIWVGGSTFVVGELNEL